VYKRIIGCINDRELENVHKVFKLDKIQIENQIKENTESSEGEAEVLPAERTTAYNYKVYNV
jgi:hypothetical protein